MARVTIIIPNYNGKQLLENCIRTLERQTCRDFHLLIVDNGSTDGSGAVTSETLDIEWIFLKKNTGFCGAVNVGIARTKTPYFLLLNNDTEAEPDYVKELLGSILLRRCLRESRNRSIYFRAARRCSTIETES